ncbi:MAG: response regulator transcription factor [Eubacteriales bacterium]|nr:response regulator transcription factor [Eubacteriales bacterium]
MIWCVEDDESIREIEVYSLQSTGMDAKGFEDGRQFFEALKTDIPDLVILDIMLPEISGVDILRKMKADPAYRDIPVIMATAKGEEYDKVQSLDLGADDYLVKPFGMMEMIARVKAVLRRSAPRKKNTILSSNGITLDIPKRVVMVDGRRIDLTYKEFELLRLFLSHPGFCFSREQLFSDVWGMEMIGESRTLDVHIRTLRQKLGQKGALIKTVRNVGYRMEAE